MSATLPVVSESPANSENPPVRAPAALKLDPFHQRLVVVSSTATALLAIVVAVALAAAVPVIEPVQLLPYVVPVTG